MDSQRLILFVIFSFSLLMLWEAWQKENRPAPAPQVAAKVATPTPSATGAAATPGATPAVAASPDAVPATAASAVARERIKVRTDLFLAEIDTLGGDIAYLELLQQKDTLDQKKNFLLLGPEHRYVAQAGLVGPGLPNHTTLYRASVKEAELQPGQDKLELRLEATGPEGVKVTRVLSFQRDSYVIGQRFEIANQGATPVAAHAYFQLARDNKAPAGDNYMAHTYTGPAVFTDKDKFIKVDFSDIDKGKTPYSKLSEDGWVGMVQHYFVSAILPPAKGAREFYTRKVSDNYYTAGVILPLAAVAPGTSAMVESSLYAGPQVQGVLEKLAPGLELVVDYGFLTVIAVPLFWVLQMFYGWSANWGLAIILLTVMIKAIFYPLSAASYKSMAKMKLVTPKMTRIREQYGNDRAKMNQAMMELYKTEKINPLGGCLPILVQIPVFISLYWVLLAAVELRHAPFYGWITDLASPDPWYVLPVIMMVSMVFQTKMNPVPPDPVQAKVMMIMPFAFGIMFFFFPAGLVLYWVVNNILSIAQQWQITRAIEGAAPAHGKR